MRERRGAQRAWGEDRRKGDHFENLGVEGRIILKRIFKKWNGKAWTVYIRFKDRWRARVNVLMNFRVL
jgi:hypothetical protein